MKSGKILLPRFSNLTLMFLFYKNYSKENLDKIIDSFSNFGFAECLFEFMELDLSPCVCENLENLLGEKVDSQVWVHFFLIFKRKFNSFFF